jgi:hypothetical protein
MQHGIVAGMMHILAGTALYAAVYASGAIQMPTDIVPVAHEVSTVKPEKPAHDDDDCVSTGVVKNPSGAVYGEEDCPGLT